MDVDIIFLLALVSGAVVPGDFFSTDSYVTDRYFNHHIDSAVARLNHFDQPIHISLNIQNPKAYNFPVPVEGHMIFHGLHSFVRTLSAQTKRQANGETDLLGKFKFSNISGIGNFSSIGNNTGKTYRYYFRFNCTPAEVEVFFLLTKDIPRKRMSFQFMKPPHYVYNSRIDLAVGRLLEEKIPLAFNILFKKLYDILHRKLVLQSHDYDPHFDRILDKILKMYGQSTIPLKKLRTATEIIRKMNRTKPDKVVSKLNMTISGLESLTRLSKVLFQEEVNGDVDLRTSIRIGNLSGAARIDGYAFRELDNKTFEDKFTFTTPPVDVNIIFYVPRERSHKHQTFHFVVKPNFKPNVLREDLKRSIQKVIDYNCQSIYSDVLNNVLNNLHQSIFYK